MLKGMLVGLCVAFALDERQRRRRGRRHPAAGRTAEPPSAARALAQAGAGPLLPGPRTEGDLSDEQLVARVQAMVDIPPGVEVTAVEGAVVLFGRVPRFAFAALLSRVARVPGVADVEDRLTPVDDLGGGAGEQL
ncbi:BON domain-containing protein [Anaeromyxobacter diazotrophicus]|uniref:BON domain-containing protein n=1 Tax=Anaeromyxobacter diazotrophicus TaxID=2590199 RepID=A0A7I9VP83_9BACT|nr:BON domain-containing protein [Anaeromyxobacter diazotrophicus]GEJ58213.1 hypothetical protein AMYX_29540 [Anaeromyxobacter diazotrophicus]